MSHSRIFELSKCPIPADERYSSYDVPEWFVDVSDYTTDIELPCRETEIKRFAESFAGLCAWEGEQITFQPCIREKWFSAPYKRFKEAAAVLSVCSFEDFCGIGSTKDMEQMLYQLKSAFEDKFGVYVYDVERAELCTLDVWLRDADLSTPYYVGGIVDYHL